MTSIADFAVKQNAFNTDMGSQIDATGVAVNDVKTIVTNLNAQINTLQNSPGAITPADQATLDALTSSGAALDAKVQALAGTVREMDTLTPPVPPGS